MSGQPSDDGFHAEWEAALAELELDVERAEQLVGALRTHSDQADEPVLGTWVPPLGIGPLPQSLGERAAIVLRRQLAVIEDIAAAAVHSRQHLEVHRRMRSGSAGSRPLYVDASV